MICVDMSVFHSLTIKDIIQETSESVSFSLEVPDTLKEIFRFKPGQYLTFKIPDKSGELRRCYSIISNPFVGEDLRVAVKKVANGHGSVYINHTLKANDSLDVFPPLGNFFPSFNSAVPKHYVLFAGGSGITPMISIIKAVLHKEPKSTIALFYGNREKKSIMFFDLLNTLSVKSDEHLKIYHLLENDENARDKILSGLMTEEKISQLLLTYGVDKKNSEYFICGPGVMMENVKKALQRKQVGAAQIHIEYFTAPAGLPEPTDFIDLRQYPFCKATITCDGDTKQVSITPGDSVLHAALFSKIDAPHACTEGSCGTCRAKLTSGKVDMKVHYALLDQEVKDGYILTCQARPLTSEISVDYDRAY